MEKFVATIGRRWTFMEHMELPAYRDGLFSHGQTGLIDCIVRASRARW